MSPVPRIPAAVRARAFYTEGNPDECWRWTGCTARGYGQIWEDGRMALAHRVIYEAEVGPIPEGMQLDHVRERGCMHRDCVNWYHLEPVTGQENNRRSTSPSAANLVKTHCVNGHEFTPENTYFRLKDDARICRACGRERWRAKRIPLQRTSA